ncbi:MAG: signal peptidase I [Verrucomicrobiae bacterium]|nr:signal peptidase I [Verrucomicrobiae bacterium]
MEEDDLKELHATSSTLNDALKKKGEEDWGKVRLASEELEAVLKRVGGYFYPQNFWAENAEMFLVAAIVALAIRTFFLQPFKIPTNSMYPTYNGMTHEVFEPGQAPGAAAKLFRFLAWGAVRREVVAENSGEVIIPIAAGGSYDGLQYETVRGRKWLVFPALKKEYTIYIGDRPEKFIVPADFTVYSVLKDAFFPNEPGEWDELLRRFAAEGRIKRGRFGPYLSTGKTVQAGETALSFDILTGDALFVDRISYHFKRPKVGEAIVFQTGNIPAINEDKYYIKRLVGTPGDVLRVEPPTLYRNGEPISGSKAFSKNAEQEGKYSGYTNMGTRYLRSPDETVTIPEDSFFAMGDNSPHSSDSRFWGFVPKKEMVGKAIFIYYPFSHRWGLAK